jgi:hypothetical protein
MRGLSGLRPPSTLAEAFCASEGGIEEGCDEERDKTYPNEDMRATKRCGFL